MFRPGKQEPKRFFLGILALAASLLAATGFAPQGAAADYQFKVLHYFCTSGITRCPKDIVPGSGLIMDAAGNLYGVTSDGGVRCRGIGCGTVFELSPDNTAASGWAKTVLYRFCPDGEPCTDGVGPSGDLIMDAAGNLYGTASGRSYLAGIVFELSPNANHTAWSETVLHGFCPRLNCADGSGPGGLIMDGAGNLYGTTYYGGAHRDGIMFELSPNAERTAWSETVLYSFCARANCADGSGPSVGLIMDAAGNLYGATASGGVASSGVVFELSPNAERTAWSETVLYSFCARRNCTDGSFPNGGLVMDGAGNVYGTTYSGGNTNDDGVGVVFELTPDGPGTAWNETVLYAFCPHIRQGRICPDGAHPKVGPIMDGAGNLFGSTVGGAAPGGVVVFELSPNAGRTVWNETVLRRFCCQVLPYPDLILDRLGNLYGTTFTDVIDPKAADVVFELVKSP